jgi:hypothetical protein
MCAAIYISLFFNAVTDDPAIALGTARRELLYGALETVESIGLPLHLDLERLVVFITALIASRHDVLPVQNS